MTLITMSQVEKAKVNWHRIAKTTDDNELWRWIGIKTESYWPLEGPEWKGREYCYDIPDPIARRLLLLAGPHAATLYKAIKLRESTHETDHNCSGRPST